MTEAEMAIRKALHEMDLQKGNGIFNLPALRQILERGLVPDPAPVRVVRRAAVQGAELLGLDDTGGH